MEEGYSYRYRYRYRAAVACGARRRHREVRPSVTLGRQTLQTVLPTKPNHEEQEVRVLSHEGEERSLLKKPSKSFKN
jgi:hypothetical protein